MKPTFAIIGCGKVGKAFARHLAEAGYRPAGFASRSVGSAKAAAERAGVPDRWFEKSRDAAEKADIVLISTPDAEIAAACREIAESKGFSGNSTVFHCSGALSSDELAAAKECGARVGSLHPLQSFAAEKPGNPFDGIMMALEGDAGALELAVRMARDLKAWPFTISTGGKILYHAAAVVASNYLVTLMGLAIDLMVASGVEKKAAFGILSPLIQGTLKNIETVGIPDALTGPISRGDASIVEAHVKAIAQLSGKMAKFYCQAGRETISIAREKGSLSESAARELSALFDGCI